jgi:hypothetical protein
MCLSGFRDLNALLDVVVDADIGAVPHHTQ